MAPLRSRGSRNKGYLLFFLIVLITTPSPPARRRGSKRPHRERGDPLCSSPPARRRGSKPARDAGGRAGARRLPRGGVDRNIKSRGMTLLRKVASRAEAWIETRNTRGRCYPPEVASRAEAWIETAR